MRLSERIYYRETEFVMSDDETVLKGKIRMSRGCALARRRSRGRDRGGRGMGIRKGLGRNSSALTQDQLT